MVDSTGKNLTMLRVSELEEAMTNLKLLLKTNKKSYSLIKIIQFLSFILILFGYIWILL